MKGRSSLGNYNIILFCLNVCKVEINPQELIYIYIYISHVKLIDLVLSDNQNNCKKQEDARRQGKEPSGLYHPDTIGKELGLAAEDWETYGTFPLNWALSGFS